MAQDDAAKRRAKLQALRNRKNTTAGDTETGSAGQGAGDEPAAGGDAQRRERLMRLVAARRQGGGAAPAAGGGGRPQLRELLARRRGQGGEAAAEGESAGAGKRLQKPTADSSAEEIASYREQLETRISRLEKLLEKTRSDLQEAEGMEAGEAATPAPRGRRR